MATVQLRLHDRNGYNELRQLLVNRVLDIFAQHDDLSPKPDTRVVREVLEGILDRRVQAYRVCSQAPRCHSQLRSLDLSVFPPNVRWERHCRDEHRCILLFKLTGTLQAFITDVAEKLFKIIPPVPSAYWLKLKAELNYLIEETLGIYLFSNPACEDCSLCVPEEKIDPTFESRSSLQRKAV